MAIATPTSRAVAYAKDPSHGGAAFKLHFQLKTGNFLSGTFVKLLQTTTNSVVQLDKDSSFMMFIDENNIVSVGVEILS